MSFDGIVEETTHLKTTFYLSEAILRKSFPSLINNTKLKGSRFFRKEPALCVFFYYFNRAVFRKKILIESLCLRTLPQRLEKCEHCRHRLHFE